jgi:hypothetical protein
MVLGQIAQSVEQRIENPCVGGSIPPLATKRFIKQCLNNSYPQSYPQGESTKQLFLI